MSDDLFTIDGQRKYLNAEELDRFIAAAKAQERPEVRTLCLVLSHYRGADFRSLSAHR